MEDTTIIQKFNGIERRLDSLFEQIQKDANNTALVGRDIEYLKRDIGEIKTNLDGRFATRSQLDGIAKSIESFVTKDQFDPVRRIVYGLVAVILTSVIVALLGLVLIKRI